MAQLSEKQKAEMFEVFCGRPACSFVAKKCGVSIPTVVKYRDKYNWLKRLEQIRLKAFVPADNGSLKRMKRHIQQTMVLQKVGIEFFTDASGKIKKGLVKTADQAIKAVIEGVRLEREISGDANQSLDQPQQITIIYVDSREQAKQIESRSTSKPENVPILAKFEQ